MLHTTVKWENPKWNYHKAEIICICNQLDFPIHKLCFRVSLLVVSIKSSLGHQLHCTQSLKVPSSPLSPPPIPLSMRMMHSMPEIHTRILIPPGLSALSYSYILTISYLCLASSLPLAPSRLSDLARLSWKLPSGLPAAAVYI